MTADNYTREECTKRMLGIGDRYNALLSSLIKIEGEYNRFFDEAQKQMDKYQANGNAIIDLEKAGVNAAEIERRLEAADEMIPLVLRHTRHMLWANTTGKEIKDVIYAFGVKTKKSGLELATLIGHHISGKKYDPWTIEGRFLESEMELDELYEQFKRLVSHLEKMRAHVAMMEKKFRKTVN